MSGGLGLCIILMDIMGWMEWSGVECLNAFCIGCIARRDVFVVGERFFLMACRDGCHWRPRGWKNDSGLIKDIDLEGGGLYGYIFVGI